MIDSSPITPQIAALLARWSGLGESAPAAELAAVFEVFRQRVERLYAVDVERFEFDFLQPDGRER